MKKGSVIAIIIGVLSALAAAAAILYVLDKKGVLKLNFPKFKRTKYEFTEEFPEEEAPIEVEA